MRQLAANGSAATAATAADFEEMGRGLLPGLVGIGFDAVEAGQVRSRLTVDRRHMAPNGYLHAASAVALADTSCGYGSAGSLPARAPRGPHPPLQADLYRVGQHRRGPPPPAGRR